MISTNKFDPRFNYGQKDLKAFRELFEIKDARRK